MQKASPVQMRDGGARVPTVTHVNRGKKATAEYRDISIRTLGRRRRRRNLNEYVRVHRLPPRARAMSLSFPPGSLYWRGGGDRFEVRWSIAAFASVTVHGKITAPGSFRILPVCHPVPCQSDLSEFPLNWIRHILNKCASGTFQFTIAQASMIKQTKHR